MTKIYVLERNGIPFYIGKTNDTIRRKHKHYQTYGTDIMLTVIDVVEDWKYWEEYWIEQFKTWGFTLLNQNKGGGGPEQYTEEQKVKMRKPRIIGTGDKISKTLKQRNHSKYYTEEVRQRISEGNKILKPFSDEHKQNMLIAKRKQAKPLLMFDLEKLHISCISRRRY